MTDFLDQLEGKEDKEDKKDEKKEKLDSKISIKPESKIEKKEVKISIEPKTHASSRKIKKELDRMKLWNLISDPGFLENSQFVLTGKATLINWLTRHSKSKSRKKVIDGNVLGFLVDVYKKLLKDGYQ